MNDGQHHSGVGAFVPLVKNKVSARTEVNHQFARVRAVWHRCAAVRRLLELKKPIVNRINSSVSHCLVEYGEKIKKPL